MFPAVLLQSPSPKGTVFVELEVSKLFAIECCDLLHVFGLQDRKL